MKVREAEFYMGKHSVSRVALSRVVYERADAVGR
jgi:hypothetical protein